MAVLVLLSIIFSGSFFSFVLLRAVWWMFVRVPARFVGECGEWRGVWQGGVVW